MTLQMINLDWQFYKQYNFLNVKRCYIIIIVCMIISLVHYYENASQNDGNQKTNTSLTSAESDILTYRPKDNIWTFFWKVTVKLMTLYKYTSLTNTVFQHTVDQLSIKKENRITFLSLFYKQNMKCLQPQKVISHCVIFSPLLKVWPVWNHINAPHTGKIKNPLNEQYLDPLSLIL